MDRSSEKNNHLIFYIVYLLFVFSLSYLFSLAIGLDASFSTKVFIVIIESMIVKFFLFTPLILYAIMAVGFLTAILVNNYINPFLPPFIERTILLFDNIIGNLKGEERIAANNTLIFWLIIIAIVTLFTAVIIFKNKKIYTILPVYLSFFLYYWYNFLDQAYVMIFIFLLSYLILLGVKNFNKEKETVHENIKISLDRLHSAWIQTVLTYSMLIVFIALLLPKGYNYIQWPWLQQKVYNTFPIVEKLRSYNTFSRGIAEAKIFDFSITGYQNEPSRLGGPVSLSNKKIMTLYTDEPTYLRGNIKQVYKGNYWDIVSESSKSYRLREDFSNISKEDKKLFYKEISLAITNHDFASKTIFSPYMPTSVDFSGNHWVEVNNDYLMTLSKGIYNNESYFIKALKPLPYGILKSLEISRKIEDIPNLELYLQLPEDKISQRTRSLASEIVENIEDDFDKAVAIEAYLRNNYKYNLNVNHIPDNYEFVDYFLFEEKEGYCTYYATAMAVMLRLEGIPCRYVEGYLAKDAVKKGVYEIKHENAHAWVEAYIEPVGWMIFEPTPAYDVENRMENYQKSVISTNENEQANQNNDVNLPGRPRNFLNNVSDDDLSIWEPGSYAPGDNVSSSLTRNIIYIIIIALLSIVPIRLIYNLIKFLYNEKRMNSLSNKKKFIYLYKQILFLTELLGYPQHPGETHYEYSKRVAYKFYNRDSKGIKEITDIFVKSKYSSYVTTNEDIDEILTYRKILTHRLKNHLGILKYLASFLTFQKKLDSK
jgi:transglutaminase-like putative cysteine protease